MSGRSCGRAGRGRGRRWEDSFVVVRGIGAGVGVGIVGRGSGGGVGVSVGIDAGIGVLLLLLLMFAPENLGECVVKHRLTPSHLVLSRLRLTVARRNLSRKTSLDERRYKQAALRPSASVTPRRVDGLSVSCVEAMGAVMVATSIATGAVRVCWRELKSAD